MHYELVIRMAAVLAALGFGSWTESPRQENLATAAVDAVIGFRRTVMADTLRFDACSVFTATGRLADFPAGIGPANLPVLDRQGPRPCDTAEMPARFVHRVYVDSLALSDSVGFVYLTIRRGESMHRETFTLPYVRGGWGVREARIWGAFQFIPPPPQSGTRQGSHRSGIGGQSQHDTPALPPLLESAGRSHLVAATDHADREPNGISCRLSPVSEWNSPLEIHKARLRGLGGREVRGVRCACASAARCSPSGSQSASFPPLARPPSHHRLP